MRVPEDVRDFFETCDADLIDDLEVAVVCDDDRSSGIAEGEMAKAVGVIEMAEDNLNLQHLGHLSQCFWIAEINSVSTVTPAGTR